jgi:hypothetical protein
MGLHFSCSYKFQIQASNRGEPPILLQKCRSHHFYFVFLFFISFLSSSPYLTRDPRPGLSRCPSGGGAHRRLPGHRSLVLDGAGVPEASEVEEGRTRSAVHAGVSRGASVSSFFPLFSKTGEIGTWMGCLDHFATYIRTKIRRPQEVQCCISCLYGISNSVATRLFKVLHQAKQDNQWHLRVARIYFMAWLCNLFVISIMINREEWAHILSTSSAPPFSALAINGICGNKRSCEFSCCEYEVFLDKIEC